MNEYNYCGGKIMDECLENLNSKVESINGGD